MKHILLFAIALFTLNATAQQQKPQQKQGDRTERPQRINKFKDFTPEQMAELKTKKMTLDFDLTEAQKKEIYKLNLKEATDRKKMMEARKARMEERKNSNGLNDEKGKGQNNMRSKEERFNMANDHLDKQIALKKEMKRILNDKQFEKWEKVSKARNNNKKDFKNKDRHQGMSNKKGRNKSDKKFDERY